VRERGRITDKKRRGGQPQRRFLAISKGLRKNTRSEPSLDHFMGSWGRERENRVKLRKRNLIFLGRVQRGESARGGDREKQQRRGGADIHHQPAEASCYEYGVVRIRSAVGG